MPTSICTLIGSQFAKLPSSYIGRSYRGWCCEPFEPSRIIIDQVLAEVHFEVRSDQFNPMRRGYEHSDGATCGFPGARERLLLEQMPDVIADDENVGSIYVCLAARVTRRVLARHSRKVERRLKLRFSNNRTSRRDIGCCPCWDEKREAGSDKAWIGHW